MGVVLMFVRRSSVNHSKRNILIFLTGRKIDWELSQKLSCEIPLVVSLNLILIRKIEIFWGSKKDIIRPPPF
jgi:hypothetical protein